MIYDTRIPFQRDQLLARASSLAGRGKLVELKEYRPRRTNRQNRYLHLLVGYFAIEQGEGLEYCKEQYFKIAANASLFVRTRRDDLVGDVRYLRSSAELSAAEMATAIDRFKRWSADTAGIYLPEADDQAALDFIEIEIKKNERWL